MLDCPNEVMNVFDNGGYTLDRYTISIMYENGECYVISSCKNPYSPMGVWGYTEGYINSEEIEEDVHIGKEIDWYQLPEEVQRAVRGNFKELTYSN